MKRWLAAAGVALALVGPVASAGASQTGPTATVTKELDAVTGSPPVFTRPLTIGGLRVTPPGHVPALGVIGMTYATAQAYAQLVTASTGTPPVIGIGDVTVTGVGFPLKSAPLTHTPAWVLVYPPTAQHRCQDPRHPLNRHGVYQVVVLFGAVLKGGDGALTYDSAGNDCGHTDGATIAETQVEVPVPFVVTGPVGSTTTLRYQAPSCATDGGYQAQAGAVPADELVSLSTRVPLDRTGCKGVTTHTTTVKAHGPAPTAISQDADAFYRPPASVLGTLVTTAA